MIHAKDIFTLPLQSDGTFLSSITNDGLKNVNNFFLLLFFFCTELPFLADGFFFMRLGLFLARRRKSVNGLTDGVILIPVRKFSPSKRREVRGQGQLGISVLHEIRVHRGARGPNMSGGSRQST